MDGRVVITLMTAIKHIFYLLVFLECACLYCSCSTNTKSRQQDEYFEGIIYGDVSIKCKTDSCDQKIMNLIAGNGWITQHKNGNYFTLTNDAFTKYVLFNANRNRFYEKRIDNDTLFWIDCSKPGSKVLKYEITPKKEYVSDVLCDELKIYYENRTVTIYYNPDSLKVNPKWYINSKVYNEHFIYPLTGSLFYKYISEKPNYTMTITITQVIHKKIDEDQFTPGNSPQAESPDMYPR